MGSIGSGDGQFVDPHDVAVDATGNVYVVDNQNSRIQVFDGTGTFLGKWGSFGSGDGQFGGAASVAVDGNGHVYLVDANPPGG